ncbi:hypothetical protein CC1G_04009 [Coprinopsis cinerea okayama7|uniref:CHAT domain-containing protein n=1 Tax=Coprinopsis cinerea (strain Okayama-7 / 130 / ATCC MYA-4618 / FGSC 9003) TaxID=240176 RepID=A8N8G2_COPC7|nr:hypothetical protein CC1G_04009 [Coprinopsis cinerea okayama7\|eukprot:XP_001831118.1 hypothetical protein CC1G_04009 [Coprinopsis cinerea okayama7\
MGDATICTSGEPDCTAMDGHESSGESAQGEDELQGALARVNELLDGATKEMNGDVLANTISILRDIIRDEEDEQRLAKSKSVLIKALVTRFARYGLVEDLDEGVDLLLSEAFHRFAFTDQPRISHSEDKGCADNVSSALDSLGKYRRAIDVAKLETAIDVANEALACYCGAANGRGELLLRVGNALVLRWLASGDERDLDLAGASFQDARGVLGSGCPMLFTALLYLQHIASIKIVECKGDMSVGLLELKQLREEMETEDAKGRTAYMMGSQLMDGDNLDVEESIVWLRQSLSFRPLRHPRRLETLDHCTIALRNQFGCTYDSRDLEECVALYREALALRPSGRPGRPRSLNDLASSLLARFQHQGDFRDLEESVILGREALALSPPGHPERSRSLHDLATSLGTRFHHKGDFRDLEESVLFYREALPLCPPGHPNHSLYLYNLANSLRTCFLHKRDFRDLEESVTWERQVLALRPSGHPDRSRSLYHLASSLLALFQHNGDFRDLEESVTLGKEALKFCPPGHPNHSHVLNNLANSLHVLFQHKGDFRDLEESIALHRKALSLRLPGHPDHPRSLNDLATSLSTRFHHKGDFRDLEESIALVREALTLLPPGHPDRPRSLNDLAGSLLIRFQHKGDFRDLEESIAFAREALPFYPPGDRNHFQVLNNLANSLRTCFLYKGDFRDLEECIALERQALILLPPGHPDHPRSLNDLAASLGIRFHRKGDPRDLEECMASLRDALLLYSKMGPSLAVQHDTSHASVDHPFRIFVIKNLVENLIFEYRATTHTSVLDEMFQLLRSGAQSHGSSPFARLDLTELWVSICREFDCLEIALEAYSHGVAILPHLASLDLTLEQRQNVLVYVKDLSRDAVQCAIGQWQLDTAVAFLSTARSTFWSQALQFRGSFDRLDALHPDLASYLRSVTRQLEIAIDENLRTDTISAHDLPRRPYLLAQRREEIITRIRAIDGFHDFLLPPSFDTLKSAARDGPIVFLNASKYGCDILLLKQDGTLHRHLLSTYSRRIDGLADAVQQLSRGKAVGKQLQRKIDDFCETETRNTRLKLRRKNRGTADDDFKQLLDILWVVVAEPVIRILGLQRTDNPKRIWWCPTGPFAFLPIHAAGIYSDTPEASDCLSDYVVSSYCSSPQDLLAPPPAPNPDYEMLAVVEPGEPGRRHSLPFTLEEVKKIRRHIPHERHLVTRVGSADTPSSPDAILNHLNTASIVHFGCHGSQDLSNPLDSSLILSGGRLTMRMLIRGCQASNAALAYLSACETAMGDQERPDESLSLAATMQFAGFRSVVATMW